MRRFLAICWVCTAAIIGAASLAHAAGSQVPLLSPKRVAIGFGAQREEPFGDAPGLVDKAVFTAGLAGAYNLAPHVSIVGTIFKDIERHAWRSTVGFRIRIKNPWE
jgi:hypothetical protein